MTKEDILVEKIGQLRSLNKVYIYDMLSAMDEYAEFVSKEAYRAGQISSVDAEHGLPYKKFDEWFKEFKENKL